MLQTIVAMGKNLLGTNVEQLIQHLIPFRDARGNMFFLDWLNWHYRKALNPSQSAKDAMPWPQPETVHVEDQQRGSRALERQTCNQWHKHSTRLWLLVQPPWRTSPSHWSALQTHWRCQTTTLRERGNTSWFQALLSIPVLLSPFKLTQVSVAVKYSHMADHDRWAESAPYSALPSDHCAPPPGRERPEGGPAQLEQKLTQGHSLQY